MSAGRGRGVRFRPSALEFLYLLVGLFLVYHYRWMMDDAFVYLRYVDNLVLLDLGLVYNAGEYVEGFSSPLYCAWISGMRALGLSWTAIVVGTGLVAWTLFWGASVELNRRMSPPEAPLLNLPLALLCACYGANSFFTSGLETPLVQLAAPITALYLVSPGSRGLSALFGTIPLIRPELALAVAVAGAFVWIRSGRTPRPLILVSGLAAGTLLAGRVYYYADLLPNTFYLKGTGSAWLYGVHYVWDTLRAYPVVPILVLGTLLAGWARRWQQRESAAPGAGWAGPREVMLIVAILYTFYVARLGGTHVHYWYLAYPSALLCLATAGIIEEVASRRGWMRAAQAGLAGVVALGFLSYPSQLRGHPFDGQSKLRPDEFGIDDPLWHRRYPALKLPISDSPLTRAEVGRSGDGIRAHGYGEVVATGWCHEHYLRLDTEVIHGFGLTDSVLARVDTQWLKAGHGLGLTSMARELADLRRSGARGPGMYRRAIAEGRAPDWVVENLEALELLAAKAYNDHDFFENVALALRWPPRIKKPDRLKRSFY